MIKHPFAGAVALAVALILALGAPSARAAAGDQAHADAETRLHRTLDLVDAGRLNESIREVDLLIARYPNFRLAHLVRGDLLLARSKPIREPGSGALPSERLRELRSELETRVRDRKNPPPAGHIPRYLLRLDAAQKHAIVVDARIARVYVYETSGDTPRLVRDFYSTIGKNGFLKEREGDKKTPIGTYYVTSYIPGNKLPDLYGWGAFPISYPNEWDRRLGRTGHGIWLHGVPSDTYARSPLASDGCVALANPEMDELSKFVRVGVTPVIIADKVEWLSPQAWKAESEAFAGTFEQWRRDWESRNVDRYLEHYSKEFRADGMDYGRWAEHKRRVTSAKKWIKLELTSVSMLRNPGAQPLMVLTFDQYYSSDTMSQRGRKRQFWVAEEGRWKIAYEAQLKQGALSLPESFPKGNKTKTPRRGRA